jgi:integrase
MSFICQSSQMVTPFFCLSLSFSIRCKRPLNWWVGWWVRDEPHRIVVNLKHGVGMTLHKLTALAVMKAKLPGTYADGGGLNLIVTRIGTRRWELRICSRGRRRQLGLGTYPSVTLEKARSEASSIREKIKMGEAPPGRRVAQPTAPPSTGASLTLRDAFSAFFSDKRLTLQNEKVIAAWPISMERYVFSKLGNEQIAAITTRQVADALRPIWHTKIETAQKVRERLKQLFDWAIACEHRVAGNPAIAVRSILGPQNQVVIHHPALPHARAPELVQRLRAWDGFESTKLALEWLLLTVTRSSETRFATWHEVDIEQRLWTIPAQRMKTRREHVVPLAPRCLEIVDECRTRWPHQPLLFLGHKVGRPLSENAFCNAIQAIGLGTEQRRDGTVARLAVAHGLRSTFRDWAAEVARARHEVAEACLAHSINNAVVAAYLRTDFLAERNHLMASWAAYCCR